MDPYLRADSRRGYSMGQHREFWNLRRESRTKFLRKMPLHSSTRAFKILQFFRESESAVRSEKRDKRLYLSALIISMYRTNRDYIHGCFNGVAATAAWSLWRTRIYGQLVLKWIRTSVWKLSKNQASHTRGLSSGCMRNTRGSVTAPISSFSRGRLGLILEH